MSRGKYSPNCPMNKEFKFNCYGKAPDLYEAGDDYDEKTMYDDYDDEGFDYYGYSAFDRCGQYVGPGKGIDRNGYTEMDYLTLQDLSEEEQEEYYNS